MVEQYKSDMLQIGFHIRDNKKKFLDSLNNKNISAAKTHLGHMRILYGGALIKNHGFLSELIRRGNPTDEEKIAVAKVDTALHVAHNSIIDCASKFISDQDAISSFVDNDDGHELKSDNVNNARPQQSSIGSHRVNTRVNASGIEEISVSGPESESYNDTRTMKGGYRGYKSYKSYGCNSQYGGNCECQNGGTCASQYGGNCGCQNGGAPTPNLQNSNSKSNMQSDIKLLYVGADWCGATRNFDPVWEKIVKKVNELNSKNDQNSKIETIRVRINQNPPSEKESQSLKNFGITHYPTLFLLVDNKQINVPISDDEAVLKFIKNICF